jgi:hypothetical protein
MCNFISLTYSYCNEIVLFSEFTLKKLDWNKQFCNDLGFAFIKKLKFMWVTYYFIKIRICSSNSQVDTM